MIQRQIVNTRGFAQELATIYIPQAQLQIYLSTLQYNQRKQLQAIINNHPQVDKISNGRDKILKGSTQFIRELNHLIKQRKKHEDSQILEQSSQQMNQIKRKIIFCLNLNINEDNYREFIGDVLSVKKVNRNVFELTMNLAVQRQKSKSYESSVSVKSPDNIYVTNRCIGVQNIFIIFKNYRQIIELQSIIDEQWRLSAIQQIIKKFQKPQTKLFAVPFRQKQIFFFKLNASKDWPIFIQQINKRSKFTHLIVTKYAYFKELAEFKHLFISQIKVAIQDQQLPIDSSMISNISIRPNEQSINDLKQLVVQIAQGSFQIYHHEQELDSLTCYNLIKLYENKAQDIILIKPRFDNPKDYVYFTFYDAFMEIQYVQGGVFLKPRDFNRQIENKYLRQSFENIKKMAIVNQLPFFYFCQQVVQVRKTLLSQIKQIKSSDSLRLIYYSSKIKQNKYKITLQNEANQETIIRQYDQGVTLKFDQKGQMQNFISGLQKTDDIIRKFRQPKQACIQLKKRFSQLFLEKAQKNLKKY